MSTRSRLPAGIRHRLRRVLNTLAVDYTNVTTGDGFSAGRGVIVSAPHGLAIGNAVSIGPRSVIQVDGSIGDWVMIGMNVHIVGRRDHEINEVGVPMLRATWVGDRDPTAEDRVEIEDDVWIGASSVVLSGVRIGIGSVVAAGSVVVRDVAPFEIVAGVPARKVGERFESESDRKAHERALITTKLSSNGTGLGGDKGGSARV